MTETRTQRSLLRLPPTYSIPMENPAFADIGLSVLTSLPGIEAVPMREFFPVVRPEQLQGVYGAIVMDAGIDSGSVSEGKDLLAMARRSAWGTTILMPMLAPQADMVSSTQSVESNGRWPKRPLGG